MNYIYGLLIVAMCYVTYTDIKKHKIPNKVTFPVMLIGIIANTVAHGFNGTVNSLLGIVAGFLVFMAVGSFIKGVGYGDVKMLMAIGSVLGYPYVIEVFLLSITLAFIIKILSKPKMMWMALKSVYAVIFSLVIVKKKIDMNFDTIDYKFIFGPYIMISLIVSLFTKGQIFFYIIGK